MGFGHKANMDFNHTYFRWKSYLVFCRNQWSHNEDKLRKQLYHQKINPHGRYIQNRYRNSLDPVGTGDIKYFRMESYF